MSLPCDFVRVAADANRNVCIFAKSTVKCAQFGCIAAIGTKFSLSAFLYEKLQNTQYVFTTQSVRKLNRLSF